MTRQIGKVKMLAKEINSLNKTKASNPARHCNLCGHFFSARHTFRRYCEDCRAHGELIKFNHEQLLMQAA